MNQSPPQDRSTAPGATPGQAPASTEATGESKPKKNTPGTTAPPDEGANMIGNRDQEPSPFGLPGDREGPSGRGERGRTGELVHWDALEPDRLAALEADPETAGALDLLREAEHWLWAESPLATLPCPGANELYDHGRGPGYRPLAPGRREELAAHLAHCPDCHRLKETLASPPPMPLVLEVAVPSPPASPTSSTGAPLGPDLQRARDGAQAKGTTGLSTRLLRHPVPGIRRSRTWSPLGLFRLVPVAAALLVLALGMSFFGGTSPSTVLAPDYASVYPSDSPLLRGAPGPARAALLFPRGRLLATDEALGPVWLQAAMPVFELTPVKDATEYRVALQRLRVDAFAEGDALEEFSDPEPVLVSSSPLAPGNYRWEATALVRGLPRDLGAMDFVVVEDRDLMEELHSLDGDPRRGIHAVQLLHRAGFRSDARSLARILPASPGRDTYLDLAPAR